MQVTSGVTYTDPVTGGFRRSFVVLEDADLRIVVDERGLDWDALTPDELFTLGKCEADLLIARELHEREVIPDQAVVEEVERIKKARQRVVNAHK